MNTDVWFAPPWLWLTAAAAPPGAYLPVLAGAGAFAAILLVMAWAWRRAGALAAAGIVVLAELFRLAVTLQPPHGSALLTGAAATAASYAAITWIVFRQLAEPRSPGHGGATAGLLRLPILRGLAGSNSSGAPGPRARWPAIGTVLGWNVVLLALATAACAAAALVLDTPPRENAVAGAVQALGWWCAGLDLLLAALGAAALLRSGPPDRLAAVAPSQELAATPVRIAGLVLMLAYGASLLADGTAAARPGSDFALWAALLAAGARMLLLPGLVLLREARAGGSAGAQADIPTVHAAGTGRPISRPDIHNAGMAGDSGRGAAEAPGFVQVEQRLAALAEALQQQAQRLSLMSHELRAPVSTISAATQSLEIVLAGTDPQVEARLQRIGRAVARMGELMDQMLGQERVYDQALAPRCTQVNIAALAGDVIGTLRDEAAHTLRLHLRDAPDAAASAINVNAYCDGPLTGVVLRNLIHNAIKYSPANQPIDIEIGVNDAAGAPDSTGAHVWIAVQDSGPGIGAEDLERIFEPHFRRAAHRETQGLGLGLHLVRRICERQGGTLTVASQPGHGARFTMTLPLRGAPYQAAKT